LCASFEQIELARKPQEQKLDSRLHPQGAGRGCKTAEAVTTTHSGNDGLLEIPLTYFEFGTLAAMQCFINHKVEVAILEVGLGGRLDAVNVFDNDCAVIASVDIDHTDYLGDTREKIAFEKAGIFRAGRVAICADVDVPLAMAKYAEKIGAELWKIGKEFGFDGCSPSLTLPRWERGKKALPVEDGLSIPSPNGGGLGRGQWNYHSKIGTRSSLPYPALRGAFQLNNASAALAVLDVLKEKLPVNMGDVRRGLGEVQLAGRFQFVPGKPTLILDVAHNPHAARSLAQNLASLPPCPNTYAVFAMLKDKDIAGVIAALDPHIDTWLVAGIDTPRGASAGHLEQVLQQCRVRGEIINCVNIPEAIRYAYNAAGENDRIIAFGSFYTVAEVMAAKGLSVTE
jgi:dihydrofolate synthase/folylpolyglutamate synthase